MSLYELAVLFDPRLPEEDVANLSDGVKELLTTLGAQVTKEESWGKKRLAYPIQKLTEARYVFYSVETDGSKNPFPEVEQRLEQNDKVLRYMTVRLDAGRLRHRGEPDAPATAEPVAPVAPAVATVAPSQEEAS